MAEAWSFLRHVLLVMLFVVLHSFPDDFVDATFLERFL